MNEKKVSRLRRARRSRMKMRELGATRLSVCRTPKHIYAQVISPDGGTILAQASTLDSDLRAGRTGNVETAAKVGTLIAENVLRALAGELGGAEDCVVATGRSPREQ